MPIQLEISPRILKSVASLYTDVNRIFLEYIDNSLDSAEEFYDDTTRSYSKKINIEMWVVGSKANNGKVIIKDNCTGVENLPKVVNSIGDSEKKHNKFSNGQFGFGIHSYTPFCECLNITSKLEQELNAYSISIDRAVMDKSKQSEVQFPDPVKVKSDLTSGTVITLTKFEKNGWKQIKAAETQHQIERHFEILLSRRNLQITLHYEGIKKVCKPFNYDEIEGEIFPFEPIKELKATKGRKDPKAFTFQLKSPINIFLKLTKNVVEDRHPIFVKSGRRIEKIKNINSFRSKNKITVWSHPHLIGYIDLGTSLSPTIARTDFRNDYKSTAVFNAIKEIEKDILLFIKDKNTEAKQRHFSALENQLNKTLSKLARSYAMNFRTDYLKGDDINLQKGGGGEGFTEDESGGRDRGGDNTRSGEGNQFGENEGNGMGIGDVESNIPSSKPGEGALNKEMDMFEDSEFKGKERKKSGFNIKLWDGPPPVNESNGKQYRSLLNSGEIHIYTEHKDFVSRCKEGRMKDQRITSRLVTYLAGQITIHFLFAFHNKKGEPKYGMYLFEDLVNLIYLFEEDLSPFIDQNLSEFSL